MPKLLAIEDDGQLLQLYEASFTLPSIGLLTAQTGTEGVAQFVKNRPDAVLLDINLPDQSGLEVFRTLQGIDDGIPIIFVTALASTDHAIEAMALGAFDYLRKPFALDQLRDLVQRAFGISRSRHPRAALASKAALEDSPHRLIGNCLAMQDVYKAIGRVAPQDVSVLILGESGTGKEVVARAIYKHSRRSSAPFLAINCAAIPEALLESELFGHERGSFTGATQRRIGKFEQASGGTLFLDEVGDMTPLTQTKVLRVLQEREFVRVGGNETLQTDVRIIAATNRDLERLVRLGLFRRDLFYRLNVFALKLPALRDRGEDLETLALHFIKQFSREWGKEVQSIAPDAMALLRRYTWPGNLRELQSVLKHALLQASGPILLPEFLPAFLGNPPSQGQFLYGSAAHSNLDAFIDERLQAGTEDLYEAWLARAEHHLLLKVLQQTAGNISRSAKILGIHRATLRSKLRALGLSASDSRLTEGEP